MSWTAADVLSEPLGPRLLHGGEAHILGKSTALQHYECFQQKSKEANSGVCVFQPTSLLQHDGPHQNGLNSIRPNIFDITQNDYDRIIGSSIL